MVSTYSPALRLELMATGDQSGTWGATTNVNLGTLLEQAITGYAAIAQGDVANLTLTTTNGSSDQARNAVIKITGALTAARNVVVQTPNKVYIVVNGTTGGFGLTFKTAGGTGVLVPMGATAIIYSDGTNVLSATNIDSANPITLTYTDAGALIGPYIASKRISSTPAASDILGGTIYYGSDSGLAEQEYARTYAKIISPTAASEVGSYVIQTVASGTEFTAVEFKTTGATFTGSGNGYLLYNGHDDLFLTLVGGTDQTSAYLQLNGKTHATDASDYSFVANSVVRYQYDFSALTHTFTGKTVMGGTTTNDSAAAGQIGEVITSSVAPGSAVALTTATDKTVTSISLTAGDWDVSGNVGFFPAAGTSMTFEGQSISLTNNTLLLTGSGTYSTSFHAAIVPGANSGLVVMAALKTRISVASTTTVYLIAEANFTVSTLGAYGSITARRAR